MDKYEFIESVLNVIQGNKDKLQPLDVVSGLITILATFVEAHAQDKETGMGTIETYRKCLERAYSLKNPEESVDK